MNTTNRKKTHVPSDLREQFQEWLDSYEPDRLQEIDVRPVAAVLDALTDCGDVLPADYCDQLAIPKGSTYAEAVADVRQSSAKHQSQSSCVEGTKSKARAAESEGLGPFVGEGFVVGYHPDINGPGAVLVDFKPTRAELMTLGYHYLERFFAVQETGATGYSGSFEIREGPFTWRRFESISKALSPDKPIEEFEQYIDRRWTEIDELRREVEKEAGMQRDGEVDWKSEGF
jgi:hypothetical protein